jgi:protein tyrosine kinase modulator
MERNQQSEPLLVIEQPSLPQQPVKPKRLKLFAISFALAAMAGVGAVFLAEMLDKSIRGSRELVGVVDSHLMVTIPYITTAGEVLQKKRKIIWLWAFLGVALFVGVAAALYIGIQIDFSWFDRPWMDSLTRLSK